MHLEIRTIGKKKKYYLAHSHRIEGKVKKSRRYLGMNLTQEQINALRPRAEQLLGEQIHELQRIRDPLKEALSSQEIRELHKIIKKDKIKVKHLDKKDWEKFTEAFTYNTNAIEGSTVKLSEVKNILEEDKWPAERTKAEVSETYGVAKAIGYIRKTKEHVSVALIKKLHGIVFKNSKPFSGRFRDVQVVIRDRQGIIIHEGAPSRQINNLLKELVSWYNKNKHKYHPIVLATVVHNQFENIHPFQDGNGRMGRILLNNILLKHELPPVNIELKNRAEYYAALRAYDVDGDIKPMIRLILKEYKL
jgi:Fic family protein